MGFGLINCLAVLPFATPWLFFAGASATAVPIIIHLLNRRRFRIIVWAAMDFLLAAQRRNARRLKFQRWVLLILRCLALIILAAAVAQFFLQDASWAGVLGAGERVVVVVWDDSYSMGYEPQQGQASHFQRSKELLSKWLMGLNSSDKVAVVCASRAGEPLVRKPSLDHSQVRLAVEGHRISDAGTDLAAAIEKARDILTDKEIERTARARNVLLITDGSRSSLPAAGSATERLQKVMGDLSKIGKVRVVDVGTDDQTNRGITGLETTRAVVVAGRPMDLNLALTNGGALPLIDEVVKLSVDGVAVGEQKMPRVEPGGTVVQTVGLAVPTPGRHVVEAKITDDPFLPVDNVRRLVVNVVREIPLLIVDGSPSEKDHYSGGTFLAAAYDPHVSDKNVNAFVAKVITEIELPTVPLEQYSMVALCDPGRPASEQVVKNLKGFVNEGGLLVILPGRRSDAASRGLNEILGSEKGGAGLLPASIGAMVNLATPATGSGAGGQGVTFDPLGYRHPVLRLFGQTSKESPVLTTVQTMQYLRLTVPQDGSTETILAYSGGAPAVVSREVGKGRVVLFAAAAENDWTSFPAKPSFVTLMQELAYWGISRDTAAGGGRLTLRVGDKLHIPAALAEAGTWNAPRSTSLQVSTVVDDKDKRAWLTSPALTMAGTYAPAKAGGAAVVAVNPDENEADVRHVKAAELAAAMAVPAADVSVRPPTLEVDLAAAANATGGGELGRRLLLVTLLLLVTEALCARLFSVYR